jgi:hypothetical protein
MLRLRMSGVVSPLLRMRRIILILIDDQKSGFACFSPYLLYRCVGEVAALARRSSIWVIGLRSSTVSTPQHVFLLNNTLVQLPGTGHVCTVSTYEVSVKLWIRHIFGRKPCMAEGVWACFIQISCQVKTKINPYSAGVIHTVLFCMFVKHRALTIQRNLS